MSKVVQAVKNAVSRNCCVRKASKEGCKILLTRVQPYLLIDMDHKDAPPVPADSKKCDYLLVGVARSSNLEWVVPLEMKSGQLKTKSFDQLKAGAKIAERLTARCNSKDFKFRPVVAFGKHVHRVPHNFLKTNSIKFNGKKVFVYRAECGSDLRKLFG